MARSKLMDFIRSVARTLPALVIAVVFSNAFVHLLAMLAVYLVLIVQGEPMALNPGILAGAMWIGAMQGANVLLLAIPLGAAFDILLVRSRKTQALHYIGAGFLVAVSCALYVGVIYGFAFNMVFAATTLFAGLLGGFMYWLIRRPHRDTAQSVQIAS